MNYEINVIILKTSGHLFYKIARFGYIQFGYIFNSIIF